MSTDEPYRWLDAIANRREYIRDQLKGATPVFALSRPEGIFLLGVGTGQSKVFEIYDRQALAALGHPVDIEKIRQTIIQAAHQEGFTRDPEDVTLRRLLNFALGPALKVGFEQIFSAPLIVESIFAEVGPTERDDVLARVNFDGTYRFETHGVAVAHTTAADEAAATEWLREQLKSQPPLKQVGRIALAAWRALTTGKPFAAPEPASIVATPFAVENRIIETALLERRSSGRVRYRPLASSELA
ncbi:MAG: 20S proteasome subunit A/B [Opitutaceae bacterium]